MEATPPMDVDLGVDLGTPEDPPVRRARSDSWSPQSHRVEPGEPHASHRRTIGGRERSKSMFTGDGSLTFRQLAWEKERQLAQTFIDKAKTMERLQEEEEVVEMPSISRRPSKSVPFSTLFLWTVFGAGGWWSTNAIGAELPLFMATLPEAQQLGNLISMATQLGNVCPILFKAAEGKYGLRVGQLIHVMQASAVLTLLACSVLWDLELWGGSAGLLACALSAGMVGCMTDVTYWSYVMPHPAKCTKAVSLGMTCGGLLLNAVSLLQMCGRPAEKPRFGAGVFLAGSAVLQVCCWLAAVVLGRRHRARPEPQPDNRAPMLPSTDADGGLWSVASSTLGATPRASKPKKEWDREISRGVSMDGDHLMLGDQEQESFHLMAACFLLYAATYTMPTLMPFSVTAYPGATEREQLLLWMLVWQPPGDAIGRLLAPRSSHGWARLLNGPAVAVLSLIFLLFVVCAMRPEIMGSLVSNEVAKVLLPAMVFSFFFLRGILVTAVFIRARRLAESREAAEQLASNMGFCGQMGAFSANILAFLAVNLCWLRR